MTDNQETQEVQKEAQEETQSNWLKRKVTPGSGMTWYVKWIASLFIICAVASRAFGFHDLDLWLSFIGVSGWIGVGISWSDRAITFLNSVLAAILAYGLLNYYFDLMSIWTLLLNWATNIIGGIG